MGVERFSKHVEEEEEEEEEEAEEEEEEGIEQAVDIGGARRSCSVP